MLQELHSIYQFTTIIMMIVGVANLKSIFATIDNPDFFSLKAS
jgi:hypothetical protein